MQHALIPPQDPQSQPPRPPMIYVEQPTKWEYKQIIRNLENEKPLEERELNELGKDGWEMTGIVQHYSPDALREPPILYFYFKRQLEK